MRIAICDDDKVFIKKMFETVKTICGNKNIKCQIESFQDGLELIENYDQYHLIFLDIDMPMINGIDVCKQINDRRKNDIPYIVFVTNKDNMVFTALKEYPFAFIRKFELIDDISACITKVKNKLLIENQDIYVKQGRDIVLVNLNEVLYLEKIKNYIFYHTSATIYKERSNMDTKESELKTKGFLRINIGCLVNVKYIYKVESDKVILKNGTSLAISTKYKNSFKKAFCDWMADNYV